MASGADPHAISERGYNAFHAALDVDGEANAEESVRNTFSYLKNLGVDIEHRNKLGHTPLAHAIEDGTDIEVKVLCELGANPNAVCPMHSCGEDKCTRIDLPLLFHASVGIGVKKGVKTELLLRAGADPLAVDSEQFTALDQIVATLCSEASDYEESIDSFFEGLGEIEIGQGLSEANRDAFIAGMLPRFRAYVSTFSQAIPIDDTSEYAESWRAETVECIALLCAYEKWAELNRTRQASS